MLKLSHQLIVQTSSKPGCRLLCPYKKVVILIEETTEELETKQSANKIRETGSVTAEQWHSASCEVERRLYASLSARICGH